MTETIVLRVVGIVGSPLCVATEDGQKVFDQLQQLLTAGKPVDLSFAGVESLTSAFLNGAVGQLYGHFEEQLIKKSLSVSEMSKEDKALLKHVVDTAKAYFKNPERMKKIRKETLGEDNA